MLMLAGWVVCILVGVAVLFLRGPLDQLLGAIGVPGRTRYKFELWYYEHVMLVWIGTMTVLITIPAIIWILISVRRRRRTSADASNHSDENQ